MGDGVEPAGRGAVEIVLAITAITFTNLFNRVNQTTVDFPAAD